MLKMLSAWWLLASRATGGFLNLAGFPGFIRECTYHSDQLSTHVTVRLTSLYTVVTVNGVDVYFYRLTGGIDGVGAIPVSGCRSDAIPGLTGPAGGLGRFQATLPK